MKSDIFHSENEKKKKKDANTFDRCSLRETNGTINKTMNERKNRINCWMKLSSHLLFSFKQQVVWRMNGP